MKPKGGVKTTLITPQDILWAEWQPPSEQVPHLSLLLRKPEVYRALIATTIDRLSPLWKTSIRINGQSLARRSWTRKYWHVPPIAHFLPNEWCICAAAVWSQPQTSLQSFWNMKGVTENRLSATERCRKKINKYRQVTPDINLLTHGKQWGEGLSSWSHANRSTKILKISCSWMPALLKIHSHHWSLPLGRSLVKNSAETWRGTARGKSVRVRAREWQHSSFHFKTTSLAGRFNLLRNISSFCCEFRVVLSFLCTYFRARTNKPQASATGISSLLHLAQHQAAGAPPQSQKHIAGVYKIVAHAMHVYNPHAYL